MPEYKKVKLVAIYMFISELSENELQYTCERFSNNSEPEFTDQELITVYLFGISQQQYFQVKQIHRFAKEYTCACAQYKHVILVSQIAFVFILYTKYEVPSI